MEKLLSTNFTWKPRSYYHNVNTLNDRKLDLSAQKSRNNADCFLGLGVCTIHMLYKVRPLPYICNLKCKEVCMLQCIGNGLSSACATICS
jgi:hypothetical protein